MICLILCHSSNHKKLFMLPRFDPKKFFFFCCLALFVSCNPKDRIEIEKSASAFDIEQGKASITQSNQNFIKAFKAGDSVGVSNSYATDAKVMAANMPPIVGKEAIANFFSMIMKRGVKDFQINTLNVWGDSSILAEEGTYTLVDSAEAQIDKGKYVVLWKQESGNWKMFRDIWTSDLPPIALLPEAE